MKAHSVLLALITLTVLAAPVHGADIADAARAIVSQNREAVVTIRIRVNESMSMGGFAMPDSESVHETTGVVITPDGLIVSSLTASDPSRLFESLFSMIGEELGDSMKIKSEMSATTLVFDDRSELPGAVVLRDEDLDLIFYRPEKPLEKPLKAVKLMENARPVQFDQAVLLHRLGKVGGRACAGSLVRVQALMERPRRLYFLDGSDLPMGAPAFLPNGDCFGLVVMRSLKESAGGGFSLFSMQDNLNMTMVAVPAADILEGVAQAGPVTSEEQENEN